MPMITDNLPAPRPNEPASVQRYRDLRACSRRHLEQLHKESDGGLEPDDLIQIGRRMGVVQEHQGRPTFFFEGEVEADLLMDLALHICRDAQGRTAFIRQLEKLGASASADDRLVLTAHDRSHWGLFQVSRFLPGIGAELLSVEDRSSLTLHDLNLGSMPSETIVVLLSRLVTADGISMTTGVPFMLDRRFAAAAKQGDLQWIGDSHTPWPGAGTPERDQLAIRVFSLAARLQAVEETDEGVSISTKDRPFERGGAKIGRNHPCPCGSGRKFKVCCGRG
jgi:hypothetical protein